MSTPENPSPDSHGSGPANQPATTILSDEEGEDLYESLQRLRLLMLITLAGLLLLAFGIDLFLLKQMRMLNQQLAVQRPIAARRSAEFTRNHEPVIQDFVQKLQSYGAKQRDMQVLLERYRPALVKYMGPAPVLSLTPDAGRMLTNR